MAIAAVRNGAGAVLLAGMLWAAPARSAEGPVPGGPAASPAERAAKLVAEYLELTQPDAEAARRATELIALLGSAEFGRREAASAELLRLGERALPALEKAAGSLDPEVADRARAAMARIRDSGRTRAIVEELWVLWPEAAELLRKELAAAEKAGEAAGLRRQALAGLGARLKLDDPSGKAAAEPLIEALFRSIVRSDAKRITECAAGEALAMCLFAIERFKRDPDLARRSRFGGMTIDQLREEDGVVTLAAAVVLRGEEGAREKMVLGLGKVGGRWRVTYIGEGENPPSRKDCADATLIDYQVYVKDPKKALRDLAKLLPENYREDLVGEVLKEDEK